MRFSCGSGRRERNGKPNSQQQQLQKYHRSAGANISKITHHYEIQPTLLKQVGLLSG